MVKELQCFTIYEHYENKLVLWTRDMNPKLKLQKILNSVFNVNISQLELQLSKMLPFVLKSVTTKDNIELT